ncbi:hypothetical protein QR680_008665 [Steinernema hermaphroditum]|uniref:UPAR/Ly6 domain-containing protein n=1 Tax=Steinernema hermaphroditum TaxID=289476 RepID=A0AA39IHE5_9BILA|nr:hypothetical protein QR680_008665 [Steinernema hermaphroditum]
MTPRSLLILSTLLLGAVFASVPHNSESHSAETQDHHEHKLIKCFECYEANSTVTGVCSKSSFCEGHWCVKGPDSGGVFRGCMERLPFQEQIPKCVIVKGQDGEDNENCYCNTDFCNAAPSTTLLGSSALLLLLALFSP